MSDHQARSSDMYARDSGDTIVCVDCGETKRLFDASCTHGIDKISWHCRECYNRLYRGEKHEG